MTFSQASSRTERRISPISLNSSLPQVSGGASWMTGSPRSSARQISPRRGRARRRGSRGQPLRLVVVEALERLAVLDELDRVEVASAAKRRRRSGCRGDPRGSAELGLVGGDVAAEVLLGEHVEVAEHHVAATGVAAEGRAVRERGGPDAEQLVDLLEVIIAPIGM